MISSGVPTGNLVDLIIEEQSPGEDLQHGQKGAALAFSVQAQTVELTLWILMPEGKEYRNFGLIPHVPHLRLKVFKADSGRSRSLRISRWMFESWARRRCVPLLS